jgi:hypothetical protein
VNYQQFGVNLGGQLAYMADSLIKFVMRNGSRGRSIGSRMVTVQTVITVSLLIARSSYVLTNRRATQTSNDERVTMNE